METNKKIKKKSIRTETVPTFNINLHETDKKGNTPLHIAASNGYLEKVKTLIRYIVKIDPNLIEAKNNYGSTPLHYATWFGQLGIIDYLVKQGADLKTEDKYGQTLLHAAAWNGYLDLVEYFLKNNLSLEEKDQNGNTPLLSAARNGHLKVANLLCSIGADITAQDNQGDNVLVIAAKNGYIKLMDYFAHEKKVDLSSIKDNDNNTLLHLAVLHYHDLVESNRYLKLINYLFYFQKLNLEEKNNDGKTPLDLAIETEDNDLVEHLLQLGAKIDPVKHEDYVRVHPIHQDKPEELGRYVLKQNDILTNPTLPQVNQNQKKMKRLKKASHNFSKPQETLVKDAFDMQGLNASLNPIANATHFFQNPVQASQSEVGPFNQSSISEMNIGMNHFNASQGLVLAQALFKVPRKNHSDSIQLVRRMHEDRIVESINNYEINSTAKPF